MDGMTMLLKAMGLPVDEIMLAAQRLIRIAEECKAQLDRIENRIANLNGAFHDHRENATNTVARLGTNGVASGGGGGGDDLAGPGGDARS